MAKALICTGSEQSIGAGSTTYAAAHTGGLVTSSTEARKARAWRTAGTLSSLWVLVTSNGTSGSSTVRTRINSANGNQSVSIGAGATGEFVDTTNTDSISDGTTVNYQIVTGAGGSVVFGAISTLFEASSNTVCVLGASITNGATAASTDYFFGLHSAEDLTTTEANGRSQLNAAGTLRSLWVYVSGNSRSTTTTVKSRVNGADGNLSVSVGASATGAFEDTSNSDSISSGDRAGIVVRTGTGTGTFSINSIGTEFQTSTGKSILGAGRAPGMATLVAGTTAYVPIGNDGNHDPTEANTAVDVRMAGTLSNLWVYVATNTMDASTTIDVRNNAGSTSISVSIGAGATGAFEDTTNSAAVVATDEINFRVAVSSGTGQIVPNHMSLVMTASGLSELTPQVGAAALAGVAPRMDLGLSPQSAIRGQ